MPSTAYTLSLHPQSSGSSQSAPVSPATLAGRCALCWHSAGGSQGPRSWGESDHLARQPWIPPALDTSKPRLATDCCEGTVTLDWSFSGR